MAKTAPSLSRSASASNLASTSTATPSTSTPDPHIEAISQASSQIYAYFYRTGVAYTYNGKSVARYYCKACLEHEIGVVREAREQFGQGVNAPLDLLRSIALGRIEYYVPKQQILGDHLKNNCQYLSRAERKKVTELLRILSESKSNKTYQNPYDYGSLYEAVQFPKYAESNEDLQPGSASPARIFAAHERTLLQRARMKKKDQEKRKKSASKGDMPATDEADPQAEEEYDSDDFTEAQILEGHQSRTLKDTVDFDTSKMYDVDDDDDEGQDDFEVPPDFPSSDLLKALQTHAGNLYAERGLMSTEKKPKTEDGESIPSMIQALDGSALVALGILAQELTRAQVVKPYQPQPISDFYERKIDHKSMAGLYGYRKKADKEVISRILEKLPEGSTVGLAEVGQENKESRRESPEDEDDDMDSD